MKLAEPTPGSNLPEYSVGEISQALKRTVEGAFTRVRVRGEISGFKRAASGHLYMALKDDQAVLDAVCWRGTAARLATQPEDGLEVIATGKLTTYPGRSKYQIVIDQVEIAGEGALLKLLEDRRRKLAAEGLFAEDRKRRLPFLPERIGVVTSPTGAVIRDILHRLSDRFPLPVLVWPVLVQGEGAADQIARAIAGFNALDPDGEVPRPDLLIVARGGGSLEDLWAFNEEIVVRAAADSAIPLISAVGHETDTTLIDFAADRRAPTPTAAAEMAVPVRGELTAQVLDDARRLAQAWSRLVEDRRLRLVALERGLPDAPGLIGPAAQRLDEWGERLSHGMRRDLRDRAQALAAAGARLLRPDQVLDDRARQLDDWARRGDGAAGRLIVLAAEKLDGLSQRLTRRPLERAARDGQARLDELAPRLAGQCDRLLRERGDRLADLAARLEGNSYKGVLKRGYAVVRDAADTVMSDSQAARAAGALSIEFADGRIAARAEDGPAPRPAPKPAKRPARPADTRQGDLL